MKTKIQTIKETVSFVKFGFFGLLILGLLTLNSCKNDKKPDTEKVADDQNDAKFDKSNDKQKDADFLVAAASINLEEIELGKMAQTQAVSVDVKDFAKMMVDGHTKCFDEVKALADSKQVTIPLQVTDEGKNSYKDLTDAKGKDFDKKYIDKMVDGHKDAISKFESAEKDTKDADVKAWITKTLPDLHMHLDHAKALADKMK